MCFPSIAIASQERFEARFDISSPEDMRIFYKYKIHIITRIGDTIVADTTPSELESLILAGLHPQSVDVIAAHPPKGEFHTPEETSTLLDNLADAHPDLLSVEVIGQSVSGRDILLVKLSDNVTLDETEPGILYDGSIHGNENIATEVILNFIHYCLDNYGVESSITALLNDHELYFVPMVNPDGVAEGQRTNANSCDCNRDHPFFWEPGWTGQPNYASQPETQTMVNLALGKNFVSSLSYHSGAVYFNYIWDTLPSATHPSPDHDSFVQLATGYSERVTDMTMEITQGYEWYQVHGISEESYYGSNGTLASIVELTIFQPGPTEMIDVYSERNRDAMIWFAEQTRRGVHGVIRDAVTGESVESIIFTSNDNWPIYNTSPVGDYWRFLQPDSHQLMISAPGYAAQESEELILANEADSIEQDFYLEPTLDFQGFAYKIPAVQMADPNDRHNNYSLPYMALGAPDDVPFHMGVGGFIVMMTMDRAPIRDGEGDDFTIVEAGDSNESYEVFTSENWTGPWTSLGVASGTASFDLGVAQTRYVRINDDGDGDPDDADAGFDLDAMTYALPCDLSAPEFSATPLEGAAPLEVQFLPQYSGIPGCTSEVEWDFGDGAVSTDGRPTHIYEEAGVYTVCLTATGPGGRETFNQADYIIVHASDDDTFDDDSDDDSGNDDADDDDLVDDDNDDDFADNDDDDDDSGGCGC